MKYNIKRLFTLFESNTDSLNDNKKIELVDCSNGATYCKEHLVFINKRYEESEQFRRDKNYELSIEKLKNAFDKTIELDNHQCAKCAILFRSTINDSLTNIHGELGKMTTGFFANKQYQANYLLSEKILMEFKNIIVNNDEPINL
jgi:hypothetical protein